MGAWLAAMQKAEDLDFEETCARKATEEEVFLQTKTLLNSGVIRAINQREAEALKKEALEKGIPYDRVRGKAVFNEEGCYRTTEMPWCCMWKLHVGKARGAHLRWRH